MRIMVDTIIRGGTIVRPDGRVGRRHSYLGRAHRRDRSGSDRRGPRHRCERRSRVSRPHRRPRSFQRARTHRLGRSRDRQPRARRGRRHAVLRHAAQLDAVHGLRSGRRREAGGARTVVDYGLRVMGRSRPGFGRSDGRHGRARSGGVQGVHVRFGASRISVRRRQDSSRWHARGGAARSAGRGTRRKRGDDAPAGHRHDQYRARGNFSRRDQSTPSSTRLRERSTWPERPAPGFTSCTSAPAAASPGRQKHARRGVDVSVETCPHYLFFTDDDLDTIGVAAKCAPPLRNHGEHAALWGELLGGRVDLIASDHSPCEPSLKHAGDFRTSWGGVAGVQSTLAVLLERGLDGRRLRFEHISALIAANPAARFRIPAKGTLAVGNDADLMLLDTSRSYRLDAGTCSNGIK